jgi:hypothetical protein
MESVLILSVVFCTTNCKKTINSLRWKNSEGKKHTEKVESLFFISAHENFIAENSFNNGVMLSSVMQTKLFNYFFFVSTTP